MATFVIDFQAFKSLKNEFILKELSIVSVQTNHMIHCLIKPKTPFSTLPKKLQHSINYLTQNIHGIYWEDGYMDEKDAIRLMKDTVKDAVAIYCKGSERVNWLKKTLGMFVIDLDLLSSPKSNKYYPDQFQLFLKCSYISHRRNNRHKCALQSALKYREWMLRSLIF